MNQYELTNQWHVVDQPNSWFTFYYQKISRGVKLLWDFKEPEDDLKLLKYSRFKRVASCSPVKWNVV